MQFPEGLESTPYNMGFDKSFLQHLLVLANDLRYLIDNYIGILMISSKC